ncbi:MAG: hypothetical protein DBX06_05820 [Candidatus Poseidoniales archaeon]|nr:hypothetical protein [Candidatus Thalassarchaeaceae archaeon]MDC0184197.1 hypothetical protein [Candidatus Poseidoniales archaeon]MDC0256101.1 hypothetical protein [Candidatus Poseidoniales archaeon]RCH71206.1 MAG: hypothetical protein DBX06_06475 [Candidatus Poseidoniales archaeon]RCH71534.1 MAG: hypothetical protein DBX06_05820 [Candidatus Poseidoniales archaeon]|tara:strand:+ start:2757 stop:3347 length:591 start_codon:yes stop_codon:yes gene_type:complete
MVALLEADTYLIRKKVLKILGEAFHIYTDDSQTELLGYCELKAFKLKEDIRIYTDEKKTTELISIKARSILDFSAGYDVVDAQSGSSLGTFKRKGMKSLFKDTYILLDQQDQEYAELSEDSGLLGLIRRFVPFANILIPQIFHLRGNDGGGSVEYTQKMNPIVQRLTVTGAQSGGFDPRVVLAGGMLLAAIEGKQN